MKLSLKSILAFLLLFTVFSCTVEFQNNARLLIKGQTIDQNDEPISEVRVEAFTRPNFVIGSDGFGSGGESIGSILSGVDGSFSLITLFPLVDNFRVDVSKGNAYTRYTYLLQNTSFEPEGFTLDLEQIPIGLKANVEVNVVRISGQGNEISYTVTYQNDQCNQVFDNGEIDEQLSVCFEEQTLSRSLGDDTPDGFLGFSTLVGTSLIFTYSINGQPEQTQTITIDQPNYEFDFNY